MSVDGIRRLRARILADNKIDNNEVKELIKEAQDGFWFFKHVSRAERQELRNLLEEHQDRFEPGAKEKLADFLGLRAPTVTADDIAAAFAQLQGAMEQSRDSAGRVDLAKVAVQVQGDKAAEAALEVIKSEFSTLETVTINDSCSGPRTETRRVAPTSLTGQRASSVFDALVSAKQDAAGLDSDGDRVLSKAEREGANQLAGLSGRMVKAAVDEAGKIEPIGTSC